MRSKITKIAATLLLLQLAGCANLGVQPWERDLLAKEEMALDSVSQGLCKMWICTPVQKQSLRKLTIAFKLGYKIVNHGELPE